MTTTTTWSAAPAAITDVDCVVGEPPCLSPDSASGFVIDEAEVTFWGLCPDCQNTSNPNEKEPADDR